MRVIGGYGSAFLLSGAYLSATSALSVAPPATGPALWQVTAVLVLLAGLWRGWRGVGTGELKLAGAVLAVFLLADIALGAMGLFYHTGFARGVAAVTLLVISLPQGEGAGTRIPAIRLLLIGCGLLVVFLALPWLAVGPQSPRLALPRAILINALGLHAGLALMMAAVGTALRTAISRL